MTQKDKDLLLKDICGRLPYGVKVKLEYYDDAWNICSINPNGVTFVTKYTGYPIETNWENCKPYLFPISSMDKKQRKYIRNNYTFGSTYELFDWFDKNHFDYRGLIEKGLAIDATYENIY
jgi:hypothetical protein